MSGAKAVSGKGKWGQRAESTFNKEALLMQEKLDAPSTQTEADLAQGLGDVEQPKVSNTDVAVKEIIKPPKKIDDRNVYVFFSEESGKASFQGKFRTEHRTNKDYKLIGQVGVPKNVYAKVSAICTENEISMVELVNLLLVESAEKGGLAKDLLKRYKQQN